MKKYFNLLKLSFFLLIIPLLFIGNIASSHPLIPLEVVDYMHENPNATDSEIEEFFLDNFGGIEEYYGISPEEQDFTFKELYQTQEEFLETQENIKKNYLEEQKNIQKNIDLFLSVRTENRSFIENMKDFLVLGVEHILMGLDHVLFVISFVLIIMPWRRIFAMVTAFTIAHSLTLILAGTKILTISSRIVEPTIAASIAYMAITSVYLTKVPFFQKIHNKISVIFLFGLFHGLGFAGVFADLQIPAEKYLSSLLFFNIGVEFGQIIILLFIVPILVFLSRYKKTYNCFIKITAGLISSFAVFWVIERVFY